MTPLRFILASLRHYRPTHIAVALGVAVATAVLTGALLVGDSVRGSLRVLTLERLGRIDDVLVARNFFRDDLASELAADPKFKQRFTAAEPAILLPGTLLSGTGDETRRATHIAVVGCRPEFWTMGRGGPSQPLAAEDVAITQSLADELGVKAGDSVLLRIPTWDAIPADSPLGEKTDTSIGRRLRVAAVLPPEGLSRFGLLPSQQLPRNVFLPLGTLEQMLDKRGRCNALLVAGETIRSAPNEAAEKLLAGAFHPRLEDYGLKAKQFTTPANYVQISADQLVLDNAIVQAAEKALPRDALQPVVTYLANTLVVGDGAEQRKIPYSTITAVDSIAGIGPLLDDAGRPIRLADDEIALNRWAADDLKAKVGDFVTVNFYDPESTHGVLHEHQPPAKFRLAHIVELEKDGQPTPAADPNLTPELPGVTDQKSINDWDLPFKLVETIRTQDEDYWDQYRTTPKAFVSLATGKRLWASRWGTISLLRVAGGASEAKVAADLTRGLDPDSLGLTFLPVKRIGLAAASGTTPFDALFLGFSLFLIAAALMLIALLFKLGVEQRASELGILAAAGVARCEMASLLSREGLLVAALGATAGIVLGVIYAGLMITGLRTWWVAAIGTPFLSLHVSLRSLIFGWLAGVIVSWLTIRWSIRRLVKQPTGRLLAGATGDDLLDAARDKSAPRGWSHIREALVALVVALAIVGFLLQGEAQAGAFFGTGAVVLALLLGETRYQLRNAGRFTTSHRAFNIASLSALNTARHPGRSTLTVGLVATATFLIVAISAFRLDTGDEGTGRFTLMATSDQPIHFDLNTRAGRAELGFTDDANAQLDQWRLYSLRMAAGEDASCLNLYRPTQPRVLGMTDAFIDRGGFAWADTMKTKVQPANPWALLRANLGPDDVGRPIVPVVLDAATAIYSLHLKGVGARFTIRDCSHQPTTLEVVGLLKNSVLQGNLLVSEANFLQLFPDTGGYRYFLIEPAPLAAAGEQNPVAITQILESTLSADGFDAVDARSQLAGYLAVQNTYLSTFQTLGALGLLLGAVGLAVVQLRSVLERRRELALMRANGFRPSRLMRMVILENGVLLLGGLLIGIVAAAVALMPQWIPHEASVPWAALAVILGAIAVAGLAAGWLATRSVLDAPIVPALRGD